MWDVFAILGVALGTTWLMAVRAAWQATRRDSEQTYESNMTLQATTYENSIPSLVIKTPPLTQEEALEIKRRFLDAQHQPAIFLPEGAEVVRIYAAENPDPVRTFIGGEEQVPDPTPEQLRRAGEDALMRIKNIPLRTGEAVTDPMKKFYADADILNRVRHHAPSSPAIIAAFDEIRDSYGELAVRMNNLLPEGPLKTTAINNLIRAMQDAITSIAVTEKLYSWEEPMDGRDQDGVTREPEEAAPKCEQCGGYLVEVATDGKGNKSFFHRDAGVDHTPVL